MTNDIRDSFKQGIKDSISKEMPGLTKAAQDLMAESILKGIESSEEISAALSIAGEGMDKQAGVWDSIGRSFKTVGKNSDGLARDIARGAADKATNIAIAGLAGLGLHNYLKSRRNAETIGQFADYQNALATVAGRNERLANENSERLNELGNSIFKFAPTVASDPNVLETVLDNAVQYDGLDPQTVRSLQELEERYRKMNEVPAPRTLIL